ncbi:MAG: hypothetical protein FJX80_03525 [Bacteroidetes bacterium]|nr:hypothetical protein [Bacteroidota bacterium]
MKSIIVCFTFLIYCSIKVFSQQLPDVPLKDGYILYEFKGKVNNKKKCLAESKILGVTFNDSENRLEKLNVRLKKTVPKLLDQKKEKFVIDFGGGCCAVEKFVDSGVKIQNCRDSAQVFLKYCYLENNINYFDRHLIGFLLGTGKKKVKNVQIEASLKINFTSFNEYTIKIRKFTMEVSFVDGDNQMQDLSKYYLEVKKKSKIKKKEIKLFEDLNLIVNHLDKVILEKMNDEIQYLEMD